MKQVKLSFRISEDDLKIHGFSESSINYFFGKLDEKKEEGQLSKFIKECVFHTYEREMNGIEDEEQQKENEQLKKMLDVLPAQLVEVLKKELGSMSIVSAAPNNATATEEKPKEDEGKKASSKSLKNALKNLNAFG